MKETQKIIKILLLILSGSLLTCCTNQELKKKSASIAVERFVCKDIEFKSQGAILRGRLFLPEDKTEKPPVIIMAHGFTTTIIGMTADKYAERFSEAGFAAMLYDHRNFGISDGEPRQEINFWVQSRGYIDAIDFVSTRTEIDANKIAVWGASLSASEAFLVGSVDERVKAIINQIPAYGDNFPVEDTEGKLYAFANETVLTEQIKDLPNSASKQMPVVAPHQVGTHSALSEITAYRWFIEYGGRFGTNWKNIVSISRTKAPKDFHIGQCATQLKAPILMVVATNDEMKGANTDVTKAVFNMVKQTKKIVEIEGGHFGLLHYPSSTFNKSCKAQIDFLITYLK